MNILTNDNKFALWNNKALQFVVSEPPTPVDPYNPLGLPANTVRVRTSDGEVPYKVSGAMNATSYETATLVPGTSDVYDVYKSGTGFVNFLCNSTNVVEVLGANTTNIIMMDNMFKGCTSLTNVSLFDTSNNGDMSGMFDSCSSLTSIPLFDTSNVMDMRFTFYNCYNVQSGALALYNQVSTQTNHPSEYMGCFTNCGRDTVTGAAELAQIPSSWGGTGA